jgi:signal transduction histidine kinase
MFQKLRNKFLILNISIITLVMLAAFTMIYLTTYANTQAENRSKLDAGMIVRGAAVISEIPDTEQSPPIVVGERVAIHRISPDDSRSFSVTVDEDGGILMINSFFEMPDEAYKQAAELAWNQKKDYSVIRIDGNDWMYSIKSISGNTIIYKDGRQYITSGAVTQYNLTFLDVTDSNRALLSLLTTFLIAGFIMLFVIAAISFFFAGRAIKPIAETWEKQKQFITDASHELKTPLTIIKSNYGVLLESKDETIESQMKWFERIKAGTDRMTTLINDLLSLAAMENMKQGVMNEAFDISKTVTEAFQSMEAAAVSRGIRLSSSIQPNLTVNGDSGQIAQVVTILLDNAIKYTNDSGWIDVSMTKSKRHIICKVKNSGEGISDEDLSKVFDRFYRADQSRSSESGGYGLGLPIAKAIIEQSGGKLTAQSVPGEYTAFTFAFKT